MIKLINKPLSFIYSLSLHLLCFFISLVAFTDGEKRDIVEVSVLNHIDVIEKKIVEESKSDAKERKLLSVKSVVVNNSNKKKQPFAEDTFVKRKDGKKIEKKILQKLKKDQGIGGNQSFLKTLEETKDINMKKRQTVEEDNFIDPMIIQRIKFRISSNWNVSVFAGAKDVEMQSVILLKLDKNKEILSIINKQIGKQSNYYNIFLQSINRALYDTAPFAELDIGNYETWKEFEITFDSSGMVY